MVNLVYGHAELGERLRVSRQRLAEITARPDFPEPIDNLKSGRVWLKADIERWIKKHRPNLDRPDEE
ncbi:DNA-binding protein [Solwaraspora sp. WMMD1047]|uniref:DNA-binding protein n=1 Tax=Solwaraspora sp. WMMD1047 TaxID=3016102 RepID=UPI002416D041|nr:DNA-binding protein [Solwaraspora sp. WMMD1047]MDG4831558.1 DNA-binding protein [Solwaraspora sp. WMMD1047]